MLASGALAGASGLSAQGSGADVRWTRCQPQLEQGCLLIDTKLSLNEAMQLGREPVSSEKWAVTLNGGTPLLGEARRMVDPARPLRLMVVLDVSGSMRGQGLAFARAALRSFLGSLPTPGVDVAVVTFESRDVRARFSAAKFETPAQASARVAALPAPRVEGNTALYSALGEALARVSKTVAGAPAGAWGGVVLLTDGVNDIGHAGDDPGLLAGPDGRRRIAEAVSIATAEGTRVWLIGVAGAERSELSALAGDRGEVFVVQEDVNAMSRTLASIRGQFYLRRQMVAALPGSLVSSLGKGGWQGQLTAGVGDGEPLLSRTLNWQSTAVALPAFDGVAPPELLPTALGEIPGERRGGLLLRRGAIAGFFALVLATGWFVLPSLIWSTGVADVKVMRNREISKEAQEAIAVASASAEDDESSGPREVPPRRPDEITKDAARRIAARS